MTGSQSRRQAINAVTGYRVPDKGFPEPLGELFGRNTFSPSVMRSRLPKLVYKSVMSTSTSGLRWIPR